MASGSVLKSPSIELPNNSIVWLYPLKDEAPKLKIRSEEFIIKSFEKIEFDAKLY